MLSGSAQLMIRAIQAKAGEVLQYTVTHRRSAAQNAAAAHAVLPRFLQYIKAHNQDAAGKPGQRVTASALLAVRQIFSANR
jgi:hypothetical protein